VSVSKETFTPYQRRLFIFLSVAAFFEGYDFMALSQVLPALREDMGISHRAAGLLFMVVNLGTVLAYLLVRKADRWGRRRVLALTIAGYAVMTFFTGLAPNVYAFGTLQMVARIFLIAEYGTSMVIAAEEYPASRRGMVLGVIQAFGSLGAIICAGVVPILMKTDYGWRSAYFVGIVPLVVLAFARRSLRETRRFESEAATRQERRSFTFILQSKYRRRVLQLGAIWFLSYITMQNAVSFWKDFALTERGLTEQQAGGAIVVAALGSLPLLFLAGKLLDLVGRRHGTALILGLGAAGVFGIYSFHDLLPLKIALTLSIWGASAFLPALVAFNTELFPTELRGDAMAWSNNLIGRVGYVVSPAFLGWIADDVGWGAAMRPTVLCALAAIICVYVWLPETSGKELEETAAL
jgi:putative MFS transporter